MKKFGLLLVALFCVTLVVGCEPAKAPAPKDKAPAAAPAAKDAPPAPADKPADKPAEKK